jgi:hypothetical protein
MQDTIETLFKDINTLASQIAKELPKGMDSKGPTETTWPPIVAPETIPEGKITVTGIDPDYIVQDTIRSLIGHDRFGDSYLPRWYPILRRLINAEIFEFIKCHSERFNFPDDTFKYIDGLKNRNHSIRDENIAPIVRSLLWLVLKVTPPAAEPGLPKGIIAIQCAHCGIERP